MSDSIEKVIADLNRNATFCERHGRIVDADILRRIANRLKGLASARLVSLLAEALNEVRSLKDELENVVDVDAPPSPDGMVPVICDLTHDNAAFDAWVKTLPARHWAKYDLSACRLGWEAGVQCAMSAAGEDDTRSI